MLQLLKYLMIIRFRKIFAKDDFFAIGLLLFAVASLCYFFQINYSKYTSFLMLFILQIIALQIDRKDIELLKLNSKFRHLLFLEYCILSLPILILFIVNSKTFYFLIFISTLFTITFLKNISFKILKYPFKMFDVFWTTSFRKYKLFWIIPVLGFVIYMSYKYQNPNLQYFVMLVLGVILCIPTNEREKVHFIKASSFIGKDYLQKQIITILYNSMFILVPIATVFLLLQEFQIALLMPFLLLLPIVNLLFKYVFFDQIIIHNIFFGLFIGFLIYGFPLVLIPILYSKSIKNIKIIQNV